MAWVGRRYRISMIDERPSGAFQMRCTKCRVKPGVLVECGEVKLCADCLESLAQSARKQLRTPRTPSAFA